MVEAMTHDDLVAWGRLCGWALARGHARSGDPVAIAAYLGDDNAIDHALADFADGVRGSEREGPRRAGRRDQVRPDHRDNGQLGFALAFGPRLHERYPLWPRGSCIAGAIPIDVQAARLSWIPRRGVP